MEQTETCALEACKNNCTNEEGGIEQNKASTPKCISCVRGCYSLVSIEDQAQFEIPTSRCMLMCQDQRCSEQIECAEAVCPECIRKSMC